MENCMTINECNLAATTDILFGYDPLEGTNANTVKTQDEKNIIGESNMSELTASRESRLPSALNMKLVLHLADTAGDAKNCIYPNPVEVSSAKELQEAVRLDHVCAEYKEDRRSSGNFLQSNVVVMDCDNDHTDNPEEWITPDKLDELMPDISYAIAFSRHHMVEKNGKAARPKFHVYFEIDPTRDVDYYVGLKKGIFNQYPFFDGNALDAARFIFGSDAGGVIWHPGEKNIDQAGLITIAEEADNSVRAPSKKKPSVSSPDKSNTTNSVIPTYSGQNGNLIVAGTRNSTMSQYAAVVLKRFGNTEPAKLLFHERAAVCKPMLEYHELSTIWNSAVRWYENVVSKEDGYRVLLGSMCSSRKSS